MGSPGSPCGLQPLFNQKKTFFATTRVVPFFSGNSKQDACSISRDSRLPKASKSLQFFSAHLLHSNSGKTLAAPGASFAAAEKLTASRKQAYRHHELCVTHHGPLKLLGLRCMDGSVVLCDSMSFVTVLSAPLRSFSHGAKFWCFESGCYRQKLQNM